MKGCEKEFKGWVTNKINDCSAKDNSGGAAGAIKVNDVQTQYIEDLNSNKGLKRFLQNKSAEFEFKDTVFKLDANQISRHHIDDAKTPQTITINDYDWFKTGLEFFILDNELIDLNITQERDKIIESLVDCEKEQFNARKMCTIYINEVVPSVELTKIVKSLIKDFVLQKNFNLSKALRKLFDRQGEVSSAALKNILISQHNAESMCKRYIESQSLDPDKMLADAPDSKRAFNPIDEKIYTIYHRSLNENKNLMSFIKKVGSVKFTFSDTIFELFIDNIRRYDLNGNPQALTFADFEWFVSALEIYTINHNLPKKALVYNKDRLAEIMGVSVEYIYNRWIINIVPKENDCFHSRMKKFVLSLSLRGDALTHRLRQLDSDPIYIQANRSLNETSVLGALAIFLTNSSVVLNALLAKPRELTHVNDDACDENNSNDNDVNWLIIGGGITAIITLILAGSYVYYSRKKSNDNHLNLALKKSSVSDLEILESLKTEMDALKIDIEHKVSKDAYTILEEKFSVINLDFEDLIDMHKSDSNPNNISDREGFVELITTLTVIRKDLNRLRLKLLTDKVDFILVKLRAIRPLPQIAVEQQSLLPTINNSHQQEKNNKPRYTQTPFSNFSSLTFKFNSEQNNENNEQEAEQPIYANLRAIRN